VKAAARRALAQRGPADSREDRSPQMNILRVARAEQDER
jgi:hypothetical protein